MKRPRGEPGTRAGFSLIEVLVASTLGALLLFALVTFMVSLTGYWASQKHDHYRDEHIVGVARALEHLFSEAMNATAEPRTRPVAWDHPPGRSTLDVPLLHFSLEEAPPLLLAADAGPALPSVEAYLHLHEEAGLGLLWHSPMAANALRQAPNIRNMNWTLLSPWVRELRYHYYRPEEDIWESTPEPLRRREDTSEYDLPDLIELLFIFGEEQEEPDRRLVAIPRVDGGPLLF
jgi:prepilin-type N-terminal cleavage/methylation domain-containing protein